MISPVCWGLGFRVLGLLFFVGGGGPAREAGSIFCLAFNLGGSGAHGIQARAQKRLTLPPPPTPPPPPPLNPPPPRTAPPKKKVKNIGLGAQKEGNCRGYLSWNMGPTRISTWGGCRRGGKWGASSSRELCKYLPVNYGLRV